jgi:hypothetical protein
MLSSIAYGRNIIPPYICYSIIVQMIDFLVNCISAPYIIKICDFVALWSSDRSVAIQILTLLMWQNFNTKQGTQKKIRSVWKSWTHFLLTVYILYKRTKFPSNSVFTSQSHKVAYFYDVGSTYAIDQKINHLHNDRVANIWRNNVPSVCERG